jgi:uncharacterized protein (DUF302 family)
VTLAQSVITLESSLSPEAAADAILAATPKEKFGVLADLDIHATLNSKGIAFEHPVRVIEVCSPPHAAEVLNNLLEISTALPCRISVFQRDGKTWLSTIKPTIMLSMFGCPQLADIAEEIEVSMLKIMKAAC